MCHYGGRVSPGNRDNHGYTTAIAIAKYIRESAGPGGVSSPQDSSVVLSYLYISCTSYHAVLNPHSISPYYPERYGGYGSGFDIPSLAPPFLLTDDDMIKRLDVTEGGRVLRLIEKYL